MYNITNIKNNILNINNSDIDSILVDNEIPSTVMIHDSSYEFLKIASGRAHYRLLMYISRLFNNVKIFDVGTHAGRSAISLSVNKTNTVISYDVIQVLDKNPIIDNVSFVLGDSRKDVNLIKSPLIMFDVNHDGKYEELFYDHLHKIHWKGILILDDIHLNEHMKKFWQNIIEEKHDITSIGAWAGTGLVVFE